MIYTQKRDNIITAADVLQRALDAVNARYQNNIKFKRLDVLSPSRARFTLTIKTSRGAGGRRGPTGRRVAAACWHAHGHMFEAIFAINEAGRVYSSGAGWITKEAGNWQDRNIGSLVAPLAYSNACDCAHAPQVFTVPQDGMLAGSV